MTAAPIFYMVLSMVVIWGTLIASVIFLALKPELAEWPPGAPDEPV
jgi:hypothetical protein